MSQGSPRELCLRCLRPRRLCVCRWVVPVANTIPVTVLQHPRERSHPFGTVRLLRLALQNFTLRLASRGSGLDTRVDATVHDGAVLLFPGPDATPLHELDTPPAQLIVIDGTWPQARKLHRENPWLHRLPKVALRPTHASRYRIRKACRAHQLSTIEAVAAALAVIDPQCEPEKLLLAFERMIDAQIEAAAPPRIQRNS